MKRCQFLFLHIFFTMAYIVFDTWALIRHSPYLNHTILRTMLLLTQDLLIIYTIAQKYNICKSFKQPKAHQHAEMVSHNTVFSSVLFTYIFRILEILKCNINPQRPGPFAKRLNQRDPNRHFLALIKNFLFESTSLSNM